MRSSPSQTTTIVASTVAISTTLFLLHKRRVAKKKQRAQLVDIQSPSDANKIGQVAYVRIRTSNLDKSVKFYTDLGLVCEEDTPTNLSNETEDNKYVLLKSPKQLPGQPLLLLEYDPKRKARTANASDVGYARICLLVKDVHSTEKQMKELGYTCYVFNYYILKLERINPAVSIKFTTLTLDTPYSKTKVSDVLTTFLPSSCLLRHRRVFFAPVVCDSL